MGQLELRRCRHCVHPVATRQVEPDDGFRLEAPLLFCYRCDRLPHPENALFAPDWDARAS